jgi:hypothetical protein
MNQRLSAAPGRARALLFGLLFGSPAAAGTFALGCIPTAPAGSTVAGVAPEVRLGDCADAEQGLEFAPFTIGDFESGTATSMYSYTDNTSAVTPSGYQPAAELGKHCTSDPGIGVFHMTGGPFLGWGGGVGVSMANLGWSSGGACTKRPFPPYCYPDPVPGDDTTILNKTTRAQMDLSQWDGVALWARRGAGGQPLLRVLVGNKYTDDDISYMSYQIDSTKPRFCERVRECACLNGYACTFTNVGAGVPAGGGKYCGPPGIVMGSDITPPSGTQVPTNTCDTTRCDDQYPAYPQFGADQAFAGRPCRPFTYRSGVTSSFCYGENDPLPAQSDQQCGDHWTYPLTLSTDWKLFLVPFSWMGQQGFAKRFTSFDLKSVTVVRLTWESGPLDFYIDDWRFYRVKRPGTDGGGGGG